MQPSGGGINFYQNSVQLQNVAFNYHNSEQIPNNMQSPQAMIYQKSSKDYLQSLIQGTKGFINTQMNPQGVSELQNVPQNSIPTLMLIKNINDLPTLPNQM